MQRPLTDPQKLEQAYSPNTLRWLDATGLTDVFHSWWFTMLLALLSVNIVMASLERLPGVWRYFSRPYRRPEPHFLAGLPTQVEIEISDASQALSAAEEALRRQGLKPQRIGGGREASLYAEKFRVARLAPYAVHLSLLLILAGGIIDSLWGYRGFVALTKGEAKSEIEMPDGSMKPLPFAVRCDAAGQENYADGSPKRWWSQLAVVENGRDVRRMEIEVNEPLVYGGLRFFQSSYGATGDAGKVRLIAERKQALGQRRELALAVNETAELDGDTTVKLAAFIPDFVLNGGRVESRSDQPNNPAIQLIVNSRKAGPAKVWLFPKFPDFAHPDESGYRFTYLDMEAGYFTGLQVAYEPGQWLVWAGCVLMAFGLGAAFYMVHLRVWAVPVNDGRGRLALWVGAAASKNRDQVEERFRKLTDDLRASLALPTNS